MKYHKIILYCVSLLFIKPINAQDSTGKIAVAVTNKTPTVKTRRTSSLSTKQKSQVWIPPKITGPLKVAYRAMPGFRLQVINTTERLQAVAMKTKMYTMFPRQQSYIFCKQPYYAVHQGNYLTMEEAKKARDKVTKALNIQVYIINADVVVKYYPQLEPPNAPKINSTKAETLIYTYGGKEEKQKKGKRKRVKAPKTSTVVLE
jgi:hypothetical protein